MRVPVGLGEAVGKAIINAMSENLIQDRQIRMLEHSKEYTVVES